MNVLRGLDVATISNSWLVLVGYNLSKNWDVARKRIAIIIHQLLVLAMEHSNF